MPIKAKELPDVSIRRLRHTVSASGKPTKAKHPVGGVSGLYIRVLEFNHDSQKEGVCFKNDSTLYITDEKSHGKGGNLYELKIE